MLGAIIALLLPAGGDVDCPFVSGCCRSCELLASPGCAILVVVAACWTLLISCCGSLLDIFSCCDFPILSAGSEFCPFQMISFEEFQELYRPL